MNKIETVYIASPYSIGDKEHNVAVSLDMADELARYGYYPFTPLLSHFWHLQHKHEYDFWLNQCLTWVRRCDALIRIPGTSKGADIEIEHAKKLGIPVFYSIEELLDYDGNKVGKPRTETE